MVPQGATALSHVAPTAHKQSPLLSMVESTQVTGAMHEHWEHEVANVSPPEVRKQSVAPAHTKPLLQAHWPAWVLAVDDAGQFKPHVPLT